MSNVCRGIGVLNHTSTTFCVRTPQNLKESGAEQVVSFLGTLHCEKGHASKYVYTLSDPSDRCARRLCLRFEWALVCAAKGKCAKFPTNVCNPFSDTLLLSRVNRAFFSFTLLPLAFFSSADALQLMVRGYKKGLVKFALITGTKP